MSDERAAPTPDPAYPRRTRRALLQRTLSGLSAAVIAGVLAACRQGAAPAPAATTARTTGTPAVASTPTVNAARIATRATAAATRSASASASPTRTLVTLPARRATVTPTEANVGPLRRAFRAEYVFEPHIAVNPLDPDHLAAVVISAPRLQLDSPASPTLLLATSTDGGATWTEQPLSGEWDGVVGFGPDGTLYAVGQNFARVSAGELVCYRADAPGRPAQELRPLTRAGVDKPWLGIHPQTGALYVPYTSPTGGATEGVVLQRSNDHATTWSAPVVVDPGVDHARWRAGEVAPPGLAQILLGSDTDVAVAWEATPALDQRPFDVWLAASRDGGQTFGTGRRIAASWGIIAAAAHAGVYYLLHRQGTEREQQLALAVSQDVGATWEATVVSGDLPLAFDVHGTAPGLGVAPDGTLDIVFYGNDEPQTIDLAAWRNRRRGGWVDPHAYHVYYVCSKDGGRTFSAPLRLNAAPIVGSRFVRTQGVSRRGEYLGMASTARHAYPIWIDAQGTDGTQAIMTQIAR